ncbi:MAG: hypothetical protein FWG47_05550 [Propionibacteriaceae bacterium]|nr:hypothetical protein [Propionibacteriaceae bacterium]
MTPFQESLLRIAETLLMAAIAFLILGFVIALVTVSLSAKGKKAAANQPGAKTAKADLDIDFFDDEAVADVESDAAADVVTEVVAGLDDAAVVADAETAEVVAATSTKLKSK